MELEMLLNRCRNLTPFLTFWSRQLSLYRLLGYLRALRMFLHGVRRMQIRGTWLYGSKPLFRIYLRMRRGTSHPWYCKCLRWVERRPLPPRKWEKRAWLLEDILELTENVTD